MDYKSCKHLKFSLLINYNLVKSTIIIIYNRLFSLFTECGKEKELNLKRKHKSKRKKVNIPEKKSCCPI